ncbi:MAG: YaiI/YqxD family protein [Pseudomonadota bacterium]
MNSENEHATPGNDEPQVLVDADACPSVIKDILFKASVRTKIRMTLIANHAMKTPPVNWITLLQVQSGFDVADNEIVLRAKKNDLVITSDTPLAAEVIDKGAHVLTPRGQRFTKENIRQRLNMRDFMDTLRGSGIDTGGPPPMSSRERREFANELDRYLQRYATRK